MSRRRGRNQQGDSLELLLDTICNTFGGVLFIALLVCILLQMAGGSMPSPSPTTLTPAAIESLVREQEQLLSELSRIQANQQAEEQLASRLAPMEIRQLLAERQALDTALRETESQIQTTLAANATAAGEIQRTLRDLSEVEAAIPVEQRKLAALEDAIEREVEKRSSELRLSEVRPSVGKSEVAVILRYGRAYLWHRYDVRGNRLGLNSDDFLVLKSDTASMWVRPNPLRGIPLDDASQAKSAVSNLLSPFSSHRHTIVVVARPDSYHTFPTVRDALVASGFDYRLFVMSEDGAVQDSGGDSGPVQ